MRPCRRREVGGGLEGACDWHSGMVRVPHREGVWVARWKLVWRQVRRACGWHAGRGAWSGGGAPGAQGGGQAGWVGDVRVQWRDKFIVPGRQAGGWVEDKSPGARFPPSHSPPTQPPSLPPTTPGITCLSGGVVQELQQVVEEASNVEHPHRLVVEPQLLPAKPEEECVYACGRAGGCMGGVGRGGGLQPRHLRTRQAVRCASYLCAWTFIVYNPTHPLTHPSTYQVVTSSISSSVPNPPGMEMNASASANIMACP